VGDALEVAVAGDEDLAAPNGAVGAVAGAVEGETEHGGVGGPVLGHHRSYVGVVVLGEQPARRHGLRPSCGVVAGMRRRRAG
jgi:hypothetical protein